MKNVTEVIVVLGNSNEEDNSVEYEVESVAIHYAYDPSLALNDVAMVVLTKPIEFIPGHIELIRLCELNLLLTKSGVVLYMI